MLSTATPLMQRILTTSGWPAVAFLLEEPIEPFSTKVPEWFQTIQRQGKPASPSPDVITKMPTEAVCVSGMSPSVGPDGLSSATTPTVTTKQFETPAVHKADMLPSASLPGTKQSEAQYMNDSNATVGHDQIKTQSTSIESDAHHTSCSDAVVGKIRTTSQSIATQCDTSGQGHENGDNVQSKAQQAMPKNHESLSTQAYTNSGNQFSREMGETCRTFPPATEEIQAYAIDGHGGMTGQAYRYPAAPLSKEPEIGTVGRNNFGREAGGYYSADKAPEVHNLIGSGFNQMTGNPPAQFPGNFVNYAPQLSTNRPPAASFITDFPVYYPTTMTYNAMNYESAYQTPTLELTTDIALQGNSLSKHYTDSEAAHPPPSKKAHPVAASNTAKHSANPTNTKEDEAKPPPKKTNHTKKSLSQRAKFICNRLVNYSDTSNSESESTAAKAELTSTKGGSNTNDQEVSTLPDTCQSTEQVREKSDNKIVSPAISDHYYTGSQTSSNLELDKVSNKSVQGSLDLDHTKNTNDKMESDGNDRSCLVEYSNDESSIHSPTSVKSYEATNGTSYSKILSGSDRSLDLKQSFGSSMAEIKSTTDSFLAYMSSSMGTTNSDNIMNKPLDDEGTVTEEPASSSNPESQTTFYSHDTHSSYLSAGQCRTTHSIQADEKSNVNSLTQKTKPEGAEATSGANNSAPLNLNQSHTGLREEVLPTTASEETKVANLKSLTETNMLLPSKLKLGPSKNEGANEDTPLELKLVSMRREVAGNQSKIRKLPPKLKLTLTENKAKGVLKSEEKKGPMKALTKANSASLPFTHQFGMYPETTSDTVSDGISTPLSVVSEDGSGSVDIASPASVSCYHESHLIEFSYDS